MGRIPGWLALAALTAVVAVAYGPSLGDFFVSDDFPIIFFSTGEDLLANVVRLFAGPQGGWYRPIFYVSIYGNWLVGGLDPVGYHMGNIVLHLATTLGVYQLARFLTSSSGTAALTALLFAVFPHHPEAVYWISGRNSVMAGLAAVITTLLYARQRSAFGWAPPCYVLGLLSKETIISLPLVLLAYDLLFRVSEPLRRRVIRLLPFALVLCVYVPLRALAGSGDTPDLSAAGILAHLAYYWTSPFVIVPGDYLSSEAAASWAMAPALPVVTSSFSATALVAAACTWARAGWPSWRVVAFGLSWLLVLTLPVAPVVAERLTYLPAVGSSLAVAVLVSVAVQSWREAERGSLVGLCLAGLLSANLLTFGWRAHWWQESARQSHSTFQSLLVLYPQLPKGAQLTFVGLPRTMHLAMAFENSLPYALRLLYGDPTLGARVQSEPAGARGAELASHPTIPGSAGRGTFIFQGGTLREASEP